MPPGTGWTRRQIMSHGAIALAGAVALGGGGYAGYRTVLSRPSANTTDMVQHFHSRPDLTPPVVTISPGARVPAADSSRCILLTPGQGGPGQGGLMILDTRGRLIWFSPATAKSSTFNLRVQAYRGQPVLTWWQGDIIEGYGEGVGVIADTSYQTIATVRAANGLSADLHELILTDQGTALLTVYRKQPGDLTRVGGPTRGTVLSGVAQEIDVATGRLLLEWDSLDHVDVSETYMGYSANPGEDLDAGTSGPPFDYFHINSIAVAPDGDLLISARNTCTVYKVGRHDGTVGWRLGGRKSSFAMGPGTRFYWQHDARPAGTSGLSLFDDAASPAKEARSRGLLVSLDTTAMHATLRRQYAHPGSAVLAKAEGSAQLLPDGDVFIGWGTEPMFSLFSSGGQLLLDGTLPAEDNSYRAVMFDWPGRPAGPPAVAVRARPGGGASVYASWNGATGIGSWTALAGPASSSLAAVAQGHWTGFETALSTDEDGPYFAVEARDTDGQVMARSGTVRLKNL